MSSWLATSNERYRAVLVAVALLLLLLVLRAAWAALIPFFLGLALAYVLLPIVNFLDSHAPKFLQRIKLSRPLAILIVYIVGIALVAGLLSFFVPTVVAQFNALVRVAPEYIDEIETIFADEIAPFFERIPEPIRDTINVNVESALARLGQAVQAGVLATAATLLQTISFLLGVIIVPFWLFYVLHDEAKARRTFMGLIPEHAREDVRCVFSLVDDLLSSYVRGQLLLMLLVGVMAIIILLILGVELAVLLGTFAGLFEVVPIIGPWLGAIPAVSIAFLEQPTKAVWVALAYFGIQQIEAILLTPRISGHAVHFNPAVVMVLVVVGSQIAGLLGVLLAVPLAAILRDVFQYLFLRTTERGATPQMALETLRANVS